MGTLQVRFPYEGVGGAGVGGVEEVEERQSERERATISNYSLDLSVLSPARSEERGKWCHKADGELQAYVTFKMCSSIILNLEYRGL